MAIKIPDRLQDVLSPDERALTRRVVHFLARSHNHISTKHNFFELILEKE